MKGKQLTNSVFRLKIPLLELLFILVFSQSAYAMSFKHIPTQFIVALADPSANSGDNADTWGLWHQDPGPRGCLLKNYGQLKTAGIAPANWKYDSSDWWLEEHGAIMEKPIFPLPPGQYVVTGGRQIKSILTVDAPDKEGKQHWQLNKGVKLYDVTHLPCHAARYTPETNKDACSPETVNQSAFPVAPGVTMPSVKGCHKQDYAVLFVI